MTTEEDFKSIEESIECSRDSSTTVESNFDKVEIENMKTRESVECSTMQIGNTCR